MRYIATVLILGSLIGTNYLLFPGIYVSDFFCLIAFIFVLLGKQRLDKDYFYKSTITYSCIMLASALLNFTIVQSIFINYFRNFTEGLIIYLLILKYFRDSKSFSFLTYVFIGYAIYFLIASRQMLNASLVDAEGFGLLDFGTGRNNWSFTNLLTLILLTFIILEIKPRFGKYIFLLFPFLLFNIYFSTSRFSEITLLIFFFFVRYWMGKKIKATEFLLYGIILIIGSYAMDFVSGMFDAGMLEQSRSLADDKSSSTFDDLINARLWELNLEPIVRRLNSMDILGIIIGDGISICHGVFAHTFLSTGIIGFIFFCRYNIRAMKLNWNDNKVAKFSAFVIFAMLLNDFVTNARFIVVLNTIYYMAIMGYLQTRINNYKEIESI